MSLASARSSGAMLAKFEQAGHRVRIFGEMVVLLVEAGNRRAAVRLEELWNSMAEERRFSLFCAYPIGADLGAAGLGAVCRQHESVIPGEGFSSLDSPGTGRAKSSSSSTACSLSKPRSSSASRSSRPSCAGCAPLAA